MGFIPKVKYRAQFVTSQQDLNHVGCIPKHPCIWIVNWAQQTVAICRQIQEWELRTLPMHHGIMKLLQMCSLHAGGIPVDTKLFGSMEDMCRSPAFIETCDESCQSFSRPDALYLNQHFLGIPVLLGTRHETPSSEKHWHGRLKTTICKPNLFTMLTDYT